MKLKMSKKLKIFIFLLLICFVAIGSSCADNNSYAISIKNNSENNQVLRAAQVVEALKSAKLPISKIEYFTSETDLENLLGKPNQYIEKVGWIDTRIKSNSDDNLVGGGIEVFESAELLRKRKSQWLAKEQEFGFQNYYLENKNVLMILDSSLTQNQIADYEKVFRDL